jgi:Zn-dependent peptidase ImmA (M78 family)
VYQDDLPSNISGQIEQQDNNKFIISVNKENAINRQVFTIAHELGHYFRHQNWFEQHKIITEKEEKILFNTFQKDQPQNYSNEEKQREKEANEFAAELLMPEEIVQQKWYEYKSVPKMANYFGVSEISMSIRLGNVIDDLRFIV